MFLRPGSVPCGWPVEAVSGLPFGAGRFLFLNLDGRSRDTIGTAFPTTLEGKELTASDFRSPERLLTLTWRRELPGHARRIPARSQAQNRGSREGSRVPRQGCRSFSLIIVRFRARVRAVG